LGLPEPHNADRGAQGAFRVGPFDAVMARYALRVAGAVDELAVTHMDRLAALPPRVCLAYDPPVAINHHAAHDLAACRPVFGPVPTDDPAAFAGAIGGLVGAPVGLLSFGPTAADKRAISLPPAGGAVR
jgi:adenylosuccinate synthase